MTRSALIAIGGNSLIRAGQRGTMDEQLANARLTARRIAQFITEGWKIILTHGNGPQVGAALLRSERAAGEVYTQPLDVCVASTQSEIGYFLQLGLEYELRRVGLGMPVVSLLTKVEVSEDDPAFGNPTKPVGPFYSRTVAAQKDHLLRGVEAVIDKDRASAMLASALNVDLFLISTDVDRVYLNYKSANQRGLCRVTAAEMRRHCREGHFPNGSMGPKIESALRFLADGGREVIITSSEKLTEAVTGNAGTHIYAES